jgi:hypothetical protein
LPAAKTAVARQRMRILTAIYIILITFVTLKPNKSIKPKTVRFFDVFLKRLDCIQVEK